MAKRVAAIGLGILLLAYVFRQIFCGAWILPQGFGIGPVHIQYYGIGMALAVGAGFFMAQKRAARFGLKSEQVEQIVLCLIIAGFVGARLYHIVSSYAYYADHPLEMLQVWHGGLSIYGAVFGGLVGLFIARKVYNLPSTILHLLNWLTPSLLLGQIIGRFGNFFNYELYGYPTDFPWKMFVPELFRNAAYRSEAFFHPLFLYEALANLIILAILLRMEKHFRLAPALFFSYLFLYNTLRFILEFIRIESVYIGPFRQNAVVSAVLAFAGLLLALRTSGLWQNTTNTSPLS